MAKQHEDKFYVELMKYLRGEPADITPGTNGHMWAEAAKELIAAEPHLAEPEMRDVLMAKIRERPERAARTVCLGEATLKAIDDWFARTADPYGTTGAKRTNRPRETRGPPCTAIRATTRSSTRPPARPLISASDRCASRAAASSSAGEMHVHPCPCSGSNLAFFGYRLGPQGG